MGDLKTTVEIEAGTYSNNIPSLEVTAGREIPTMRSTVAHGIPSIKMAIARELATMKADSSSRYKVRAATMLLYVLDGAPYLRVSHPEVQWVTEYDSVGYAVESNLIWTVNIDYN